ncbi:hypothetical protein BU15DRAFT_83910 [Melanogaster broomeanus]|nr:hypothetical protein BU15DRAFT_83910 [Melanogaster broomeanus]
MRPPRIPSDQDAVDFINDTAYQIAKCMQLGEQHAAVVRVDPARYERAAQIVKFKRTQIPLEDLCEKGALTDVEHLTIALAAHDRLVAHADALASIDNSYNTMKHIDLKIVKLMRNWTERYVDQLPHPLPQSTFRPLVSSTVHALPELTRPRLQLEQISDEDVQAFIRKPQRVVTVGDCFFHHDEHDSTLYRVTSCNLVATELVFGIQFEGTVDAVDVSQTEMTNLLRASSRALNV